MAAKFWLSPPKWQLLKWLPNFGRQMNRPIDLPHLSKRPSDLKQNGTQEKTPFSGTVFNAPLHGVLNFVASVTLKNH